MLLTSAVGWSAAAVEQPHIVFILADDVRWDDLAAGHPFSRTARIDRLAHEGTRFRNAFVTTGICSPSRANVLTGLHALACRPGLHGTSLVPVFTGERPPWRNAFLLEHFS